MKTEGNGGINSVVLESIQWALYEPVSFTTKRDAELFIAEKFDELGWKATYVTKKDDKWYIFYREKHGL